jgi:peptide/nickel transport system substrate-binding protein
MIARTQQILAEDVPVLPLVYPYFQHVYRKGVFDAWYFTPGGFGVGAPTVYNKQAFVTGQQEGTSIRTS